jgi:glycosyltransferase involved in cell wall biosynthesis
MIRVLHVLDELRASGAEMMLSTAADLWQKHGIHCGVLSTGASAGPLASTLRSAGYEVHHLPFSKSARYFREYRTLVLSSSYSVVHVHTERASFYFGAVARSAGAGAVRTVHSSFPFEGSLALRRALQRRLSRALGVAFVSIGQTVHTNESRRFSNPTETVSNWIDVSRFCPPSPAQRMEARRSLDVPHGAIAVATVGNCAPVKNHVGFLRALADTEDDRWIWLHVGSETANCDERHLAADLGVAQSCRFLGLADPLTALHAADVFAMPSLYEGLGLATIEAIATGLPVLLTTVPGNRELGEYAARVIWAPTDVAGLTRSIDEALSVAGGYGAAERARQHEAISARFGPEVGVAAYARIYRSVST